jgi:hypothetical protein
MNKRFPGQGRSCDINIKRVYSKEDKFSRNILIYFTIKQHSTILNELGNVSFSHLQYWFHFSWQKHLPEMIYSIPPTADSHNHVTCCNSAKTLNVMPTTWLGICSNLSIFSAKLLCTIVMRLNSIQWPIDGWMDRVNNPGGNLQLIFYHVF